MELKNILDAFVGALLATMVGPVVMAGLLIILNRMEAREARRHSEAVTRKALAIVESMRRNPGKKWKLEDPEQGGRHDSDRGMESDYV